MSGHVGWPLARLRDVTVDVPSRDPARDPESCFTYVDISSIDNERCEIVSPKRLLGKNAPSRARRPLAEGDVVFSNVRTYLRNVAQVRDLDGVSFASTGFTVLRPKSVLSSRYLYHLTRSDFFINHVTPEQTGTHYPATSDRVVRDQLIPLPPLSDQEHLAHLFDKVESSRSSASSHLQAAHRSVERFRQSILAAACSGRLTANWREENEPLSSACEIVAAISGERQRRLGSRYKSPQVPATEPELPSGWCWTTVGALVDVATGATPLRTNSKFFGGTIPWVTSGAVNAGLITEPSEFISEIAIRETNAKVFPVGTLLVAMYGEGQTRGRVAELGIEAATNQAVAALLFDEHSVPLRGYLKLFFLENYERIRQLSFGGVQPNLSMGVIRETTIPLPPYEEQQEITKRVSELLEVATRIEKAIEAAAVRTERSSQAILDKAFRGELNPVSEVRA